MSEEIITVDYREIGHSKFSEKLVRDYNFNSRPIISPYDQNIVSSVKMKKLDRNLFRSVKLKKSKLIKSYEQSKYSIQDLKF